MAAVAAALDRRSAALARLVGAEETQNGPSADEPVRALLPAECDRAMELLRAAPAKKKRDVQHVLAPELSPGGAVDLIFDGGATFGVEREWVAYHILANNEPPERFAELLPELAAGKKRRKRA